MRAYEKKPAPEEFCCSRKNAKAFIIGICEGRFENADLDDSIEGPQIDKVFDKRVVCSRPAGVGGLPFFSSRAEER